MTMPLDPTLRDLSNCDCCAGTGPSTPSAVFNRPGLSALAYRSGTWHDFKESLLAALAGSAHPELAALATRADDDFTIALLDAVATVGDVLTFYGERIANESYLRTATERVSVLELARLIGYELKPGVAASTLLAFTVDDAVGAPGIATVDIGVKVQSIPGHDEKPQTFETVEKIEARVEWNAMKPKKTVAQDPASMSSNLWLAGTATDLKVGDVILLVGPEREANATDEHWDARRVAQVIPDFNANRTHIILGARVGAVDPAVAVSSAPKAYALRTRASTFGYNAPQWKAMSTEFKKNYLDITTDLSAEQKKEWPDFTVFRGGALVLLAQRISDSINLNNAFSTPTFDLDAVYAGIIAGSWLVLATPDEVELFTVSEAVTSSRSEFAISGKTTRLSISGENRTDFDDAVRMASVYGQSELLPLAESPIDPPVTGIVSALIVDSDIGDLPDGRTLLLKGNRVSDGAAVSESIVLDHVETVGGVSRLVFTTALANNYALNSMTIYGNVAHATHGETVSEVLGSGDGSKRYQKLGLRQPPLTFVRNATSPTGTASTLELRVNDVKWAEVQSFYKRRPDERIYTTRLGDDGNTVAQFGDGVHGARLPTGRENVRALYRKGTGTGGNVRAGQLSTLLTRPIGLKGAINPQLASGGTDAEPRDNASENAPITVLTLDRVVSLRDYEDFARGYAGIAKSLATWTWDGQRRGVFVTVAGSDGAAVSDDVLALLTSAIRAAGDPFVPIRVASYRPATLVSSFKLKIDANYDADIVNAAVVDAARNHFGFKARAFGQGVALSEFIATLQNVTGVVAVDVDALQRKDGVGGFGLVTSLPSALPQVGSLTATLAAELLTLAADAIVPGVMP
ncbi:MAG: putative baseplate assembly protein [Gemmatimonadaceae bacterium]